MRREPVLSRFPRAHMGRRAAAFGIDFVAIWLVSSLLSSGFIFNLVFLVSWLLLRVVLVSINQGQSLGRWALDIKVIDLQFGRVPGLLELLKREGVTGLGTLLVAIGLSLFAAPGPERSSFGLVLFLPLVLDCGQALLDSERRQAFHDKWADTIAIATQRGYSLDLKLKKLFAQTSRRMRK